MSSGPLFTPGASIANRAVIPVPALGSGQGAQAKDKTFIQVLSEGQRAAATGPPGPLAGVSAESPRSRAEATSGSGAPALKVLAVRALDAEKNVEALLAAAERGKTFSAGELIALQATVFRYSQTVEVLSRATDRLVGALKQTLGTQV